MGKSDSLRVSDVRAAFRLIGDCRDLGSDPALWHQRMLEGLCDLFGVVQSSGGEAWWPRPGPLLQPVSAYSASLDPVAQEAHSAYHRDLGPIGDPVFCAIDSLRGKLVTRTRRELVSDADWYRSAAYDPYRKMGRIDHTLISVLQRTDQGATSVIALNRRLGERNFSAREVRLAKLFHAELGRLIGGPLASATDPTTKSLSPRLRQTLACLLEGDSEKQVAARLRLSRTTVHQYVTTLYRRFGVRSRAQLLAHAMKRRLLAESRP